MAVILRAKVKTRETLFGIGDRLCHWAGVHSDEGVTRPWLFWLGHQASELGWRLR